MNKLAGVLQSRKFWASVVGLLTSVGILTLGDYPHEEVISAILIVANVGIYTFSTAFEDGMSGRARDE